MLRGIRYLINVIAFGAVIIGYYVVVGQLTPIHHSMVNEAPDGLVCDYYNAIITPRSPPHVSWICSRGDLLSEPFPTVAAIFAVCAALFVFRFTVQSLSTNYLPRLVAVFMFIALVVAGVIRVFFFIKGVANFLYVLWTVPLVAICLLIKIYLDKPTDKERIRRQRMELSISIEIAERLKERERNGRT